MTEPRIVTHDHYPPIPDQSMRWSAWRDGDEEGLCGWGRTEQDAIDDLMAREWEEGKSHD